MYRTSVQILNIVAIGFVCVIVACVVGGDGVVAI